MQMSRAMSSPDHTSDDSQKFQTDYEQLMSQDFVRNLKLADDPSQDDFGFFRDAEAEFHESREEQYPRDSEEESVGSETEQPNHDHDDEQEDEDEDDDEFEFSFASVNPDGSPISADAIFQNGQIRSIYPLFDQSLLFDSDKATKSASYPLPSLRKLFVERPGGSDQLEGVEEETYCVWNGKSVREASPESCRKSNSTGFSKRWRFRDLVNRSSSDGKDAFVFLNPSKASNSDAVQDQKERKVGESAAKTDDKGVKVKRVRVRVTAAAAAAAKKGQQSAHEKHYVRNRAVKESDRRKSYLPYRQDLVGVGFFVNVNGMSKNLHPY